jgi:hypothetical protein
MSAVVDGLGTNLWDRGWKVANGLGVLDRPSRKTGLVNVELGRLEIRALPNGNDLEADIGFAITTARAWRRRRRRLVPSDGA